MSRPINISLHDTESGEINVMVESEIGIPHEQIQLLVVGPSVFLDTHHMSF